MANEYIVVDSIMPEMQYQLLTAAKTEEEKHQIQQTAFTQYLNNGMAYDTPGQTLYITSGFPSLEAVELLLDRHSFIKAHDYSNTMKTLYPELDKRFYAVFQKTDQQPRSFPGSADAAPAELIAVPLKQMFKNLETGWKFDRQVADNFEDHARKHIPDYDRVIDMCVDVCQQVLTDPAEDRIIEVGSATGETVKRLFGAGFHNLVGVESSSDMLDKIKDVPIAHWVNSTSFPVDQGPYHVVLCNWTLHFIKEKLQYLKDIHAGLHTGGVLILTDKTCNQGLELELYHKFKRRQGVSDQEIAAKAASLEGVMFVDSPTWYTDNLVELGFDVTVLHQVPCFTTFMCVKK